jgi:hypothetical protein
MKTLFALRKGEVTKVYRQLNGWTVNYDDIDWTAVIERKMMRRRSYSITYGTEAITAHCPIDLHPIDSY